MRPPAPPPPPPAESADLFDYALIRDYVGFVLRAPGRHRVLTALVFLAVLGSAFAALWALPKSYHTEVKILAQRNQVMSALGNPRRTVPGDADAPTRAASETVLRRDNLVALVKQTNLLDHWDANRAPVQRARDGIVRLFRGEPTEEDRLDALVGLLEKRLTVAAGEGTVTIALDWQDAQMTYRLVEAAQQNFLEARHAMEISTIAEAISILEGHANSVQESVAATLDDMRRNRESRQQAAPSRPRSPSGSAGSQVDQDVAQLKVMLVAKRRALADLEDFRRRRLAELEAQLVEQQRIYADAHPLIVSTRESIAGLATDSPQMASLRKEERELREEYTRRAGRDPDAPPPAPAQSSEGSMRREATVLDQREVEEYAQTRLQIANRKYEELLDRIDAARIELDTARAAFKYRYSVINPAQIPKKAKSPNPVLLIVAGLLGGALLALFCSVASDLRSQRVLERWQLERQLDLPVLAELGRQ